MLKTPDAEHARSSELLAADAVGDVVEHWGFRKALGRLWTVLYLAGEPLSASDLGERLQMSAGAVSMSLAELQRWAVVRRVWVPGERKDYYEAEVDFWKMISKVVSERERFLVRSVKDRLELAVSELRLSRSADAKGRAERVKKLLALATLAESTIDGFIASHTVDFSRFLNLLDFKRGVSKLTRAVVAPPSSSKSVARRN